MKILQVSEDYVINARNPGAAQPQKQERPPNPVGGPIKAAWREGALTRAWEFEDFAVRGNRDG